LGLGHRRVAGLPGGQRGLAFFVAVDESRQSEVEVKVILPFHALDGDCVRRQMECVRYPRHEFDPRRKRKIEVGRKAGGTRGEQT
jgi:hypothetical protein